jgi:hypothetical protein
MITKAMITIGTLIRKTEPHQKLLSSAPPTIGPMAMARPTEPDQMPMALGCSCRGKTLAMIARVDGMIAAPEKPIAARAAISSAGLPAYAVSTEDTPNRIIPSIRIRLRPSRSASSPQVNSSPAKISV